MDPKSFDLLARNVASGLTRRRALRFAAGGLGTVLAGLAAAEEGVEAKKGKKGKNNGNKGCKKNQQKCNGTCIAKNKCCRDADCTGAKAGACVKNTCQPAFATCQNEQGSVGFVKKAPGQAAKGDGAAMFTVGPEPAVVDWAHLRHAGYEGKQIADIEKLEYAVYVMPLDDESCPTHSPYMAIYALDGDDEHVLVSDPERDPVSCEEWQTIEAAGAGLWWMPTATNFSPQNDPKTLTEIAAHFPGMTIRNATGDAACTEALGGLRLEAGEWPGGGGAGNSVMYVSYLTVQIDGEKATFRF